LSNATVSIGGRIGKVRKRPLRLILVISDGESRSNCPKGDIEGEANVLKWSLMTGDEKLDEMSEELSNASSRKARARG
jgi:hypothetical protein